MRYYTSGSEEMRLENDGDLHVDGDVTDLRINESVNGSNCIVGLKFKGSKKELNQAINERFTIPAAHNLRAYICN